jgi:hypothetical protein
MIELAKDLHCLNCLEQLGEFDNALNGYRTLLSEVPDNYTTILRYHRLLRDLRSDEPDRFNLIWQVDSIAGGQWEIDWVRQLCSGLNLHEIVDGNHALVLDNAIVVDCALTPEKSAYYFEMLKRGYRFAIIHLSDEQYQDDWSAYDYANCVIRQYWSPQVTNQRNILALPVGFKNGFMVPCHKPASARRYSWSFTGSINRSTRPAMIAAMRSIPGGFEHTTGFGNTSLEALDSSIVIKPWLSITDYAAILGESIFSPCPIGMQNFDSFRVCESLEAGCIPIVERRSNFDYFSCLFGKHPMIALESWAEAPALVSSLLNNPAALEDKRHECETWWRNYRAEIVQTIKDHVTTHFKGRYRNCR